MGGEIHDVKIKGFVGHLFITDIPELKLELTHQIWTILQKHQRMNLTANPITF